MRLDREARNYWRQQRRQMLRRNGRLGGGLSGGANLTKVLIGLMALAWIAERFFPGPLYAIQADPAGAVLAYALDILSPGTFLSLALDSVFIWLVGSAIEPFSRWWQYLLVFFGSAVVAAVILQHLTGGFPVSVSLATFGLAGAYVRVMMTRGIGGAARWALTLLLINLVLSGFQAIAIIGLLSAFGSGFVIALLTQMDR